MANHCINPCDRCGADLGEDGGELCELCRLGLEYRDALAKDDADDFAAAHEAWGREELDRRCREAGIDDATPTDAF